MRREEAYPVADDLAKRRNLLDTACRQETLGERQGEPIVHAGDSSCCTGGNRKGGSLALTNKEAGRAAAPTRFRGHERYVTVEHRGVCTFALRFPQAGCPRIVVETRVEV